MSNAVEFLRFPPLGLLSKLRLAATIMRASRVKDWRALERVPVADWLTKWSGRRTFDAIWRPLLRAKLGDAYEQASAAFIWAIIARMYAARRSGLKTEVFGHVRGGYGRVVARFAEVLTAAGVDIRTGAAVDSVTADPAGGVCVRLRDGAECGFDRVIVTAPAPLVPTLIPGLTAAEADRFLAVRYMGVVCASVLLDKPLAGFYVTNITDSGIPFTAVVEMTALVDPAEFGGRHLVYLPKYAAPGDPIFDESDDAIRGRFPDALGRMHPGFDPAGVLAFEVARARNVFAVSTLNYSDTVPPMATSVAGVHVVTAAQIVNGTLNVNETLTLADRGAAAVLTTGPVPAGVPA